MKESGKMVRTVALACDLYVFNSYSNRVDFFNSLRFVCVKC